jgi:GNAT superfamily N-acetyltransferase
LLGVWRDGRLIGALDAIAHYPDRDTWIIGMLLVHPEARSAGIGRFILSHIEQPESIACARSLLNVTLSSPSLAFASQ